MDGTVTFNGSYIKVTDWELLHGDEFRPARYTIRGFEAPAHSNCPSKLLPANSQKDQVTMNTAQRIKNLSLDDETRLLRKYDVIDEENDITSTGQDVLLSILLEKHRSEVIEALKKLEAEDAES